VEDCDRQGRLDTMHAPGTREPEMNEPITIQHLDDATAEWIEEQAAQRGMDKETVVPN